jgi:hypothetical protein
VEAVLAEALVKMSSTTGGNKPGVRECTQLDLPVEMEIKDTKDHARLSVSGAA